MIDDGLIEAEPPLHWPNGNGISEITVQSGCRHILLRPVKSVVSGSNAASVLFMIRDSKLGSLGSIQLELVSLKLLAGAVFRMLQMAGAARGRRFFFKADDSELAKLSALATEADTSRSKLVRKWIADHYAASFGDAPPPPISHWPNDRPNSIGKTSRGRGPFIPHRAGTPRGRVSP